MRKTILGLVMVVMLMGLVGCGETNEQSNKNEINSETKETYIDGVTGERVEVEISNDEPYTYYAEVKKVKVYDNGTVLYQFEYKIDDMFGYSTYQTDKQEFEEGDVVKVTCGWNKTENKPSLQEIISVEIVEE